MGRRGTETPADVLETMAVEREADFLESEDSFVVVLPEHNSTLVVLPEKAKVEEEERSELPEEETAAVVLRSSAANNHKGLARKSFYTLVTPSYFIGRKKSEEYMHGEARSRHLALQEDTNVYNLHSF
ncbi:hypothetical protein LOK49_LG10G02363 [Camellia lanceoleosa]|uniref:Uncharacterized protein n=1 Tax=Camellia lanceoleosa TaxID=1840588 RepID=A0ACC0GEN5_9ERIC|nr:hypothetical protein LOK49_LG10G02363 [Camellia lanceoleosa]